MRTPEQRAKHVDVMRVWRAKNREHYNAVQRRWRSQHREQMRLESQKWRDAHPLYMTEYRAANKKRDLRGNRFRKYGITTKALDALLVAQSGECALCYASIDEYSARVDHNHETGSVRGLLCDLCNKGLGLFRDNAAVLGRAADYITKNHAFSQINSEKKGGHCVQIHEGRGEAGEAENRSVRRAG